MKILEVATNVWHEVTIEEVRPEDLKKLTAKRYFFKWQDCIGQAKIFKLRISLENDIKGLIALVDFPTECRIHIPLLTASKENVVLKREKGKKQKEFDEIIGNLIAFAGQQAMLKYGMREAGPHLYLLFEQINNLTKKYII